MSAETSPIPEIPGAATSSAAATPKKPPQAKRIEPAAPMTSAEAKGSSSKDASSVWPQLDVTKFFEESRERLQEAFEQANGRFDSLRGAARDAGNVCQEAHVATISGLKDINEHVFEHMQSEIDRGYDFLRAASEVKGVGDLMQLQTDFLRETMETQLAQTKALTELTSNLFRSAFEPLQQGFSTVMENARKRM